MKAFIYCIIGVLMLSVVAWVIAPKETVEGKLVLLWVSDDSPVRRAQIDLFNRTNSKYHLKLDPGNTGTDKVIVQSLAGVGPDMLDCYGPTDLSAYVKAGVAWDVTDELATAGIDVGESIWPVSRASLIHDGRVYGFPTNAGTNALWFNKEIFDRAGISYPTGSSTWEELLPLIKRLTVRDKSGRVKQYGILLDWSMWEQFVLQWGGHIYSEDRTRCVVDTPEAIAAVQFLHDMAYKHRVMPTAQEELNMVTQGGWGSGNISLFGAGQAAMAMGGRYWLCSLRQYDGLRLGVMESPYRTRRVSIGGAKATLINKQSPNRYRALEFLKFLSSQEYNELINHQADGLGPVIKYCQTEKFLHDPEYPEEDYNAAWRDLMKYAVPAEVSPFVNRQAAWRIMYRQIDLVKSNQKSVADAMKLAARQVNAEIQKTLDQDPTLRKRYEELMGRYNR